jgi:RNA polymerase sigma factor for flagellar operon FliA
VDTDRLPEVWARYKAGEAELEEDLAAHYMPLAKHYARRAMSKAPAHQEFEELLSFAYFGLLDAMRKYDLSLGLKFDTYAARRIPGAIKDHLRRQDPLVRSARAKVTELRDAEAALNDVLGRSPTAAEIAKVLEVPVEEIHRRIAQRRTIAISLDGFLEHADGDGEGSTAALGATPHDHTEGEVEVAEVVEHLTAEVAARMTRLQDRDRLFVLLYYFESKHLTAIGKLFGVNDSRAGQIRREMIVSLTQ